MIKRLLCACFAFLFLWQAGVLSACAEGTYEDTRFQGVYTTENLDAILREYELNDGWYWTTQARVMQNYHGQDGKPGWTDTSVNVLKKQDFEKGWYGCRWNWDTVLMNFPNGQGWGECYGFCQFIGYLLSGKRNPMSAKGWVFYENIGRSGGMKVGDIVRIDYTRKGQRYQHSAVVYRVEGDLVTFIQASGSNFNLLSIDSGFMGGGLEGTTDLNDFVGVKGLRIWRAPENDRAK